MRNNRATTIGKKPASFLCKDCFISAWLDTLRPATAIASQQIVTALSNALDMHGAQMWLSTAKLCRICEKLSSKLWHKCKFAACPISRERICRNKQSLHNCVVSDCETHRDIWASCRAISSRATGKNNGSTAHWHLLVTDVISKQKEWATVPERQLRKRFFQGKKFLPLCRKSNFFHIERKL